MLQRRNKVIAIIIFTAAFVLLCFWIGLLFFTREESEDNTVSEDRISVVLNGMELLMPRDYHCYPDGSDLILYDNDGFAMRLGVREDSFEELLLRKDTLIPEVESKGYTCTSTLEERVIDVRSYLFFTIDTDDGICYMIYSRAGNDSYFGVLVDAGEEEPDEVLERIHVLIDSAQETDRENTNIYDLFLAQADPIEETGREFQERDAYQDAQGNDWLYFEIPKGFYIRMEPEADRKSYRNWEANINVTLSLRTGEGSAEECILRYMELEDVPQIDVGQEEINGRTVYYFAKEYERIYEGQREQYYRFYAAIDVEEGLVHWLAGDSMENADALKLEMYTEFLTLE